MRIRGLDYVLPGIYALACVTAFVALERGASADSVVALRAPDVRPDAYGTPKPKTLTNVVYVGDSYQNVITVYNNNQGKNYPTYGHIAVPARPEGLTTDSSNQLYVTQPGGVLVYPAGTYVTVNRVETVTLPTSPTKMLVDANDPTDVAIGPDGEIYTADQGGPQSSTGGQVSVFAAGSTTVAYTIPFGQGTYVDGVTLDAANNLYIAWRDATGTAYINTSPAPAVGAMRTTGADTASVTGDVFRGVQFDDKDQAIVYADYSKPDIYTSPEVKKDQPFDRLGTPDYMSFDTHKSHLFVPDLTHNLIEIYNYPSGSIHYLLNGIPNGGPSGCAVLPAPAL